MQQFHQILQYLSGWLTTIKGYLSEVWNVLLGAFVEDMPSVEGLSSICCDVASLFDVR